MLPYWVKKCSVLREFTPQEQLQIFGISRQKFLHHIDTLYYSVYLNEPKDIMRMQRENDLPANLERFLSSMRNCKDQMRSYDSLPPTFGDLQFSNVSFSMYEWCVSLSECFDIFIGSYLPNENTPRIVVQLRSRYLVLEGVKRAVEESFRYLCEFLNPFGLYPVRVRENRIDYAFHTNYIQNPSEYFDDEILRDHLKTNLRKFSKYGDTKNFEVDTLNLGRRTSNNVFFRAYNKSREMIEMNYKSFFIERWFENKLISQFDKYVYEVAYNMRSYRSGILVGRLKWYLEFGRNENVKELCHELLRTDFVRSDNFDAIEDRIKNVIPEPTLIFNIEFQTKRKFFSTCEEFIHFKTDIVENLDIDVGQAMNSDICFPQSCDPRLHDLFGLLFSGQEVIDYLTGYGTCVCFVKNNKLSLKQFKEQGEEYLHFWSKLRSVKIDYGFSTVVDLYRKYDIKSSLDRSLRLLEGNVARLSIISKNDIEPRTFVEDLSDVLCILNDNDAKHLGSLLNHEILHDENGELRSDLEDYDPSDYRMIRERKARQLRGIVKKGKEKQKNSEASSEEKKG